MIQRSMVLGIQYTHGMNGTPMKSDSKRHGRAFTLIEVLVVVAIIALLVSILIPSLKQARIQAWEVHCRSNTHQIDLSLRMYADEQRGWLPLADYEINPHRKMLDAIQADRHGLMPAMYCPQAVLSEPHAQNITDYPPKGDSTSIINTRENREDGNISYFFWSHKDRSDWRSPIRGGGRPRYTGDMDSFRPRHLRTDGKPKPFQPSVYGISDEPDLETPCEVQSTRPSELWVLTDFFRKKAPFPHMRRHKNGLNVSYLDGHAAWMRGQPRANFR